MRFELNISMRKKGDKNLPPYRAEIKNINSFRFLEKAAEYEIKRQAQALKKGQKLIQETRGFDEKKGKTVTQRGKEEAHDYRYFPEPDIPPIRWKKNQIEALRRLIPELPDQKLARFQKTFGITQRSAQLLTREKKQADYFEKAAVLAKKQGIRGQELAKVIINKRAKIERLSPKELILFLVKQKTGKKLTREKIEALVGEILKNHPQEVARYQGGKTGLLEFFVGQVMGKSRGEADPGVTRKILIERLRRG